MMAPPRALTSHEGGCDDTPIAGMNVSWLDGVGGCAGPGRRGFAIQEENYVFCAPDCPTSGIPGKTSASSSGADNCGTRWACFG